MKLLEENMKTIRKGSRKDSGCKLGLGVGGHPGLWVVTTKQQLLELWWEYTARIYTMKDPPAIYTMGAAAPTEQATCRLKDSWLPVDYMGLINALALGPGSAIY